MENNCFWGHDWSKWKEVSRVDMKERSFRDPLNEWVIIGIGIIFERECKKCGKKQFDRQEIKANY